MKKPAQAKPMTPQPNEGKLQFPCEFTFKIIGKANSKFEGEVIAIMRSHFPQMSEGAVTIKHSRNTNYLALSITVNATSQAQLDAAYRDLTAHPETLFVL